MMWFLILWVLINGCGSPFLLMPQLWQLFIILSILRVRKLVVGLAGIIFGSLWLSLGSRFSFGRLLMANYLMVPTFIILT